MSFTRVKSISVYLLNRQDLRALLTADLIVYSEAGINFSIIDKSLTFNFLH